MVTVLIKLANYFGKSGLKFATSFWQSLSEGVSGFRNFVAHFGFCGFAIQISSVDLESFESLCKK